MLSCADAIAKALDDYQPIDVLLKDALPVSAHNGNGSNGKKHATRMLTGACPECGGAVEHEGGCAVCRNCGFTKCS